MKKSVVVFSVLLVLIMTVVTASAATLELGSVEIDSDNITVPVVLSDLPSDISDIAAITINFSYDEDKLEYDSIDPVALEDGVFQPSETGIAWFYDVESGAPLTAADLEDSDNVLFEINFDVKKGASGKAEIKFDFVEIADSTYKVSKEVNVDDLSFKVTKSSGGGGGGSRSSGGGGTVVVPSTPAGDTGTQDTPGTGSEDVTEPTDSSIVIKDIASDNWAYPYAVSLIEQNIISGDSSDAEYVLRPGDAITRQEAAKIVLLAMGVEPESGLELTFADSDKVADWAKDYVATAVKYGVISGYAEDNTVRAANNITREEMITMVVRAMGWGTSDSDISFADSAKVTWSKPYIAKALEFGIINGYEEDNTIRPNANITRAETFAIVCRALKINTALEQ